MLLSHLLKNVEHSEIKKDVEVTEIVSNSKKVIKGCVFVCASGQNFDSHILAADVERRGAVAVIAQKETDAKNQVLVDDTQEALALMCSEFYSNPSKKLKLVGVTGTNGKTSTTHMIKQILEINGKKTGLIGTVSYMSGDERLSESGLTTPEAQELHRMFYSMVVSGCEYCVMEVSSQALAQKRCYGLEFECGVFTNLTRDHLDYHKTMLAYSNAKAKLFAQSKASVINADDPYASFMSKGETLFFSAKDRNAHYFADNINLLKNECKYELNGNKVSVPIPGEFTVYNSLSAIACCDVLGIPIKNSIKALSYINGVPGRAEVLKTDTPYTVLIDYAHSPDALVNILTTVKNIAKGRVVALFGCGGDRDKTKRPLMSKAAAENSDYMIITTDNPRTENPNEIIEDILPGIQGSKTPCAIIPDRTYAIEYALKNARENDIIVLCGKGHETYQIVGTQKLHYDEREIVKNYLQKENLGQ